MKRIKTISKVCLIICAVLCFALMITQFLPNWTYEDAETGTVETDSTFDYMAYTYNSYSLTDYMKENSKDFNINSLAGTFCIAFLLSATSIYFIISKINSGWITVFPFATGLGSLIGYLTEPLWKLGAAYIPQVALSAALTVAAFIPLVLWILKVRFWFMDPKDVSSK